ncbi:uncharacterized protein METZ01_LOCUS444365, partial [marine metagenome]
IWTGFSNGFIGWIKPEPGVAVGQVWVWRSANLLWKRMKGRFWFAVNREKERHLRWNCPFNGSVVMLVPVQIPW